MNKQLALKYSLLMAALMAMPLAQAANLTQTEYKAGKTRISAEYKTEKAACDALSANAKDICMQEAKGKEKVALHDLEYSRTGKLADHNKAIVAKAEANYAIAKEKCDDKSGNDKDVCVKEAKAVEAKILADVKLGKEITEAAKDDVETKRNANYKVAAEKCDALSGDAKSSCIASAKVTYGKT